MDKKSWVRLLFFLLTIIQFIDIQAQAIKKKYNFQWHDPATYTFSDGHQSEFLTFENAIYRQDLPTIPVFYEMIPVDNFMEDYKVRITDEEWAELSASDCKLIPYDFHQKQIDFEIGSAYEGRHPYAMLSFIPIIEIAPGKYKKLISISLEIEGKTVRVSKGKRGYASQSVLASGQWYRFSLSETGIYKVTYQDLVSMGMSAPINSNQLALFGNGGKMLPEENNLERPDDLLEIPVQMMDGGDGTFNDGDYFLFYGQSPHRTIYDSLNQHFTHDYNIYSDVTYYFITQTPGIGEKKRIQTIDNESLSNNISVQDFTFFDFFEEDLYNLCESGKNWFGERYDITLNSSHDFQLPGSPISDGRIRIQGASTASTSSTFQVSVNNNNIGNAVLNATNSYSIAVISTRNLSFSAPSQDLKIGIRYNKPTTSSSAYLDWIEVEIPCALTLRNGMTSFRNPSTVGHGNVTRFNLLGVPASTTVWDVTDPTNTVRLALSSDGQSSYFKTTTERLREFIAFDGSKYLSITPLSLVANQNLHATNHVDMVIVTHPDFMSQANRLAQFRSENDGLNVKVVTIQQVYNEFSGGSCDPIAIRDYMKMIYDKTDKAYPKYLLLFGRPSYDYRGRVSGTALYVPNYQYYSPDKISDLYQYSNDDVLGLLDDNEGGNGIGLIDIAIGRFPCNSHSQAVTAVDKSIRYSEKKNLVGENSSIISNFGDWRNVMAFVADDEERNDFMNSAESFSKIVGTANPNINLDKIYLDAYQQISNAGGQRYPDAVTDINDRMNRGSLFYTYIGHSGKDGWAAERVLENSDINKWTNMYNMPVLLSLSCTFAYYDRQTLSPSDLIFFNNNGGAVAVIAATREAWSGSNHSFGTYFFNQMFKKDETGNYYSVCDLERLAKNRYFQGGASATNLAMLVTLGDPSLKLSTPLYNIVTDSINHTSAEVSSDTVRALSKVTVSGRIVDNNSQTISGFNGSIFPSVYDKKVKAKTLYNDPDQYSSPFEFEVQKSILFKGNATVKNGRFQFSFYVPKDIDYNFGNGKISYYARTETEDAAGAFTNFIIGGMDTSGIEDRESPMIELYLNDENFVNGGTTTSNPILIAKISDNYGINTTGNGIGHDLTGVLDHVTGSKIVLNDYYQTEKDSFNRGIVRYQLQDLAPGEHTITVRAWDVNNNSSEQELTFKVVSEDKFQLSHVLNYPNPFTTHTDFFFEHNQPGGTFDIQVQIYTISGKLVKTLYDTQYMEGNRCRAISWDGLDDFGDKLAKGTYLYRLRVKNEDGKIAEMIEKLVIL